MAKKKLTTTTKPLEVDTASMFYKLKAIIESDLAKLFDKAVSRRCPLDASETNILGKYTAILISIQKEEREAAASLAETPAFNAFSSENLKLLKSYSQDELLSLAASEDQE